MSLFDSTPRSLECCFCAEPLAVDPNDDYTDACSRTCAYQYALLALEGKIDRAERSPSPKSPPSSFSPDWSDEELPELPEVFPESAHVSLASSAIGRDSNISTVVHPSAVDPVYIEDYPWDERLTPTPVPSRPSTPTPDSTNQQERVRDTRLIRLMFNATDRRADKGPQVHFEDGSATPGRSGSTSALRRIVSGVSLKRSRSDSRPAPPAHTLAKSRLGHGK
ncbi:unnamed protein product [Peniophora sp. CBMAI 1063]|nr:unnamed protein product [Peniophora sp. CBMAI 1063]